MSNVKVTMVELRSGEVTVINADNPRTVPMVLIELTSDQINIDFNGECHEGANIEMRPHEAKVLHNILGEALDEHRKIFPL